MRSVMVAALMCAALAVPLSAGQADVSSPKLRIEWTEFQKLHAAGGAVVVDVRGEADYEAGHVPAARSIPLDQIEKRAPELKALKKPIVLYCA
ncbi:MAG: rhodanese-like domain-containing protein [Acidobacteriota bacterium]|nr:rhodanese-like domain-containing protein [Acidobacteriota bacterium]